jgi:hypothetical protein
MTKQMKHMMMYGLAVGVTGGLLIGLNGCQKKSTLPRGQVSTEPLVVDAAMQKREWEPTTAFYENGATYNFTTGFAYEPVPGQPDYAYYYADAGTYVLNLVTLPYTLVTAGKSASGAETLPPSYTASPPLPPYMNQPNDASTNELTPASNIPPANAPTIESLDKPADHVQPIPNLPTTQPQ